jgi:acyl phosphate:glycerol-3-phosphate acyltransferase
MNALVLVLAYLLGSIPFGYLIVKWKSSTDIRETGSGGTGATNVSRKVGKAAGAVTLLLDAAKGAAAVLMAKWLLKGHDPVEISTFSALAGFFAIVGHCFPVWLGFRAGKGVATGLGVFLAIVPWSVMAAAMVFFLIVWRTHYVSLGSLSAAVTVPLWTLIQHTLISEIFNFAPIIVILCASSALIIAKHSDNIKRLMAGSEREFKI